MALGLDSGSIIAIIAYLSPCMKLVHFKICKLLLKLLELFVNEVQLIKVGLKILNFVKSQRLLL